MEVQVLKPFTNQILFAKLLRLPKRQHFSSLARDTGFSPWALETAGAAELNDPAEMRANLNLSEAAF